MRSLPEPPAHFSQKKARILQQLAVPDDAYTDASPKGSVDEGIRDLIDEINSDAGFVTTSSCAGRVSIFVEGRKASTLSASGEAAAVGNEEDDVRVASAGGKGGGGRWLFVSHEPLGLPQGDEDLARLVSLFGLEEFWVASAGSAGPGAAMVGEDSDFRLIHFKFEPMILHVLAASASHAQLILQCGLQAGFRESGAINLTGDIAKDATPMVAIRCMGLGFESMIGYDVDGRHHRTCTVESLAVLARVANTRFSENRRRIERFRQALGAINEQGRPSGWEDAASRRERKRLEGLRIAEEVRKRKLASKPVEATQVSHAEEILPPLDSLSNIHADT